jgi:hypothetical protein
MRFKMEKQFEDFLEMNELRKKLERLEVLINVYQDRDREVMNDLLKELRINEMKLLDLMSDNYLIG